MASPAKNPRRNWLDLPRDVTASILSRLTALDILNNAQFVCRAWREVSNDPLVWKRIDFDNICRGCRNNVNYKDKCLSAVDRSCGQAVDITLEFFPDDDLLAYISDRCSRIQRLRLVRCHYISDKGLIGTIEKLPSLEDLELTLCRFFSTETLEAIGRKCPRLKAFKLNWTADLLEQLYCPNEEDYNEEAVAIGKSMPGLKSLELIGNGLNDEGLGAILDGCTGLESLDLRGCNRINLEGEVWRKCAENVKQLRLPGDSTEDYPFWTNVDPETEDSSSDSPYNTDLDTDVDRDNCYSESDYVDIDDYDGSYNCSCGDGDSDSDSDSDDSNVSDNLS